MVSLSSILIIAQILKLSVGFSTTHTPGGRRVAQRWTATTATELHATTQYLDSLTKPRTLNDATTNESRSTTTSSSRSSTPTPSSRPQYVEKELPKTSGPSVTFDATERTFKVVELPRREPVGATVVPTDQATTTTNTFYEAYGDVNTEALLQASKFPIKADRLVEIAKESIFLKGLGLNDNGECLADEFVFRGAHVETYKDEFMKALQAFNLGESFQIKQQYFGWIVDPIQTNRVWFMNRQEAIQIKEFFGAKGDGKKLILPPESLHVDFNEDGKVIEFGFYTIDRFQGNTGGLGGAFGYFYGVGKPLPFPEGHPYRMSKRRRLFETIGAGLMKFNQFKENQIQPLGSKCVQVASKYSQKCLKFCSHCKNDIIQPKLSQGKTFVINKVQRIKSKITKSKN